MDPITLILTALAAGVAAGVQTIADKAIKDSYAGLKVLIKRKFASKPKVQVTLTEHESDPQTWEAPLKKVLMQENIDQDQEIIEAAQQLMQLVKSQQSAMGKYHVQITGNVQGFAQGPYQNVTMNFGDGSKESK